jgi:hypothetical protein
VKKENKSDFDIFKAECERWIKFFGLTEWEIDYAFVKDDDKIERGSLWEFEIHIKPVMNKKTGIEFINYTKKLTT